MQSADTNHVQYGCGLSAPLTWRNFDASPALRLQRLPLVGRYFKRGEYPAFPANVEYGDIIEGLPIADRSCQAIYCSHILEHLAFQDFRMALQNTYRYLKSGGTFRFVMPDLEQLARDYLSSSDSRAALVFMESSYLGKETRSRGLKGLLRERLGNSAHLWMWDFKSIVPELANAGFSEIRRAYFGDSTLACYRDVEEIGRWEKCLGVQCIKV
jgi:hypothetical protein